MSKYTIALYEIDKSDIFDFSFTMYGVDSASSLAHKQSFIDRFYDYYYFNEINADNIAGFNRMLRRTIALVLDRYNQLFEKASSIIQGSLTDYTREVTENVDRATESERTMESSDNAESKFLDTPSVPLGQSVDNYATNITKDTASKESSDALSSSDDVDRTLSETYQAKDKLETYEKYLEAYKDLDEELIKEFKNCFLLVY